MITDLKLYGSLQCTYTKKSQLQKLKEKLYIWWMNRKEPIRPISVWAAKSNKVLGEAYVQVRKVSDTHVEYYYFLVTNCITIVDTKYNFYKSFQRIQWQK